MCGAMVIMNIRCACCSISADPHDVPEQYRAIGRVGEKLFSLIFEVREDKDGEYYHLVTLWKATRQEQQLYEENS